MISRHAFRDRLRGMTPDERRAFIAALWKARGWSVTATADGLVADRGETGTDQIRLRLVSGHQPGSDGSTGRLTDPLTVVVRDADPERPETDGRRYTSDDLYALIRYGLAYDDRTALLKAHLPSHGGSAGQPLTVEGSASRVPSDRRRPTKTSLLVPAIVGLVLVLSAITAVDSTGGTTAPFTTDHVDGREYLELRCVSVPVGLPAGALLPQFSDTGTFRQAAWSEVPDPLGATADRFRGSPLRTPERRAIAAYRGPDGHRYRVEVARWRTDWIAANATDRAITSTVRITWSYWSFDVQVISVTGEAVRTPVAAATAHGLLGTVDLAGEVGLDPDCTRQIGGL